jgi:hypothetical protein
VENAGGLSHAPERLLPGAACRCAVPGHGGGVRMCCRARREGGSDLLASEETPAVGVHLFAPPAPREVRPSV